MSSAPVDDATAAGRRVSVAPVAVPVDSSTVHEAAAATEAEHNMGLVKSFKLYRKACLWSIFLSTCIIMEGFDNALLNALFAYEPFQRQFGRKLDDGSYELTAAWQTGLSNGTLCGQILGLMVTGILADRFGFRKTIIGALTGCIGVIFIIFFAQSLPQLLAGQILIGVMWSTFQTLTCQYASEVCPVHLRPYLTTYVNLCWVIGQFIASGVLRAMLSRDDEWGFRIPFGLQWMWPVPLIIGIYLAPESPWWLVRSERLDEATRSLARLTDRNTGIEFKPDETISMMVHTNEMEKETTAGQSYADLFKGSNLRRTEIACVAWVIQAASGSAFMGYSSYFMIQAGMNRENSFSMSMGLYAIGAVGTLFSWSLMGWFGRRTLYLGGLAAMGALLLIIGCAGLAGDDNTAASWAVGAMLLVYAFVYDSTVGPVCYSLVSELPSTRLRTKSVVMARNAYNVASIVTNIITPRMLNPTAWAWQARAGFFWAGSCALCALWTYFRLPEPKGRTYGELDVLFERGVSARKFKGTTVEIVSEERTAEVGKEKSCDDMQVERV